MADALSAVQAGSLAAAMAPRFARREAKEIAALIQHHRDGTLTESIMRSGIATIAALRSIAGDLDADVRLGQAASEREVNGSTRPGPLTGQPRR